MILVRAIGAATRSVVLTVSTPRRVDGRWTIFALQFDFSMFKCFPRKSKSTKLCPLIIGSGILDPWIILKTSHFVRSWTPRVFVNKIDFSISPPIKKTRSCRYLKIAIHLGTERRTATWSTLINLQMGFFWRQSWSKFDVKWGVFAPIHGLINGFHWFFWFTSTQRIYVWYIYARFMAEW